MRFMAILAAVFLTLAVCTERIVEATPDVEAEVGQPLERVRAGLIALYDFASSDGRTVKDRSGVGQPINLQIDDLQAVRREQGSLEVRGKALIRSRKPATKVIQSVRRSREVSIEAWIKPAKTNQGGPARIVTLSANSNARNFTLGQDSDRYDVRFRTGETSRNGLPSVSSSRRSVTTKLTHVVYTRSRSGRAKIYVNGRAVGNGSVQGPVGNWDNKYELALANEMNKSRPWLGTYYLVAIYHRRLSDEEVRQNFNAGSQVAASPARLAENRPSPTELAFQNQIAPLISQHCLECHDSITKRGGLDLSKKAAALAGGDSGQVIVPGKSAESLLWESVANDDMPSERTPLTSEQKELLKQWIDDGAVWSMEVIDPAVYAHSQRGDNWLQRLTVDEYIETVGGAVGIDVAEEARKLLPPDLRADGFSNTAYNLNVDLAHVDAYAQLAEIIVSRMDTVAFAAQFAKSRKLTDNNMRGLIAKMGKWVLRGPLEEHEVVSYRGISTTVASAGGNFEEAVRMVLQAMLQSPRFLYRIENQRGDGTSWPVGDYELASRLSYILWGGPPDKELMRAADNGELDRAGVERQVKRMLKDRRAVTRSQQFIREWLDLDRLDNLRPNADKFPDWNPQLAADMRQETLAFFEHVVWKQQRPLTALLNAQVTYATPRLAEHYRLESKPLEGQEGHDDLEHYDLSDERGRGGLLTQGSVLTIGGDEASMVTRGLFVLHDLLRGVVQDPPPCVDTTPVPTKAGLTQRGIAQQRIATAACGGCHAKFEPLAFGLEKFDGLGTYHDFDEHGNPLRDDGQIVFPDTGKQVEYQSSAELMDLLAGSDRVRECMTWKLTQFALGRPLGAEDAPLLEKIDQAAHNDGGTYASLMTAIVLSELVQKTRTEPINEEATH